MSCILRRRGWVPSWCYYMGLQMAWIWLIEGAQWGCLWCLHYWSMQIFPSRLRQGTRLDDRADGEGEKARRDCGVNVLVTILVHRFRAQGAVQACSSGWIHHVDPKGSMIVCICLLISDFFILVFECSRRSRKVVPAGQFQRYLPDWPFSRPCSSDVLILLASDA